MDSRKYIIGNNITNLFRIHDYVQILFSNGGIMNIYNKSNIYEFDSKIVGESIENFVENGYSVEIHLSGGKIIRVGLSDDDYVGPEAIEYISPEGKRTIWP